jgi:hypothetical protein
MLSEFSNAHVDLGQERSPDRSEIAALMKGICLKAGILPSGSLVPELAELLFGSIGIFLFRALLRYVGPQVIAATRARWF